MATKGKTSAEITEIICEMISANLECDIGDIPARVCGAIAGISHLPPRCRSDTDEVTSVCAGFKVDFLRHEIEDVSLPEILVDIQLEAETHSQYIWEYVEGNVGLRFI